MWLLLFGLGKAVQGCHSSDVDGLLWWLLLLKWGWASRKVADPRMVAECSLGCCSSDAGRLLAWLLLLGWGRGAPQMSADAGCMALLFLGWGWAAWG